MKFIPLLFGIFFLFLSSGSFAQEKENEIQIIPYLKFDRYPEFSFNYGGRASTDHLKMRGKSFGFILNYKYALKKRVNIIGGVGYYRYSFNELEKINSLFGSSDTRLVEYPNPVNFNFSTHGYYYNTVSLNIGIEKYFNITNRISTNVGLTASNFFSFSQKYHLNNNTEFKTNNLSLFGHSLLANAGLQIRIKNTSIGPQLLMPIFDTWHKDEVFLEKKSEQRYKWLSGVGFGITISYHLNK